MGQTDGSVTLKHKHIFEVETLILATLPNLPKISKNLRQKHKSCAKKTGKAIFSCMFLDFINKMCHVFLLIVGDIPRGMTRPGLAVYLRPS